jgi:hypothetical protein
VTLMKSDVAEATEFIVNAPKDGEEMEVSEI